MKKKTIILIIIALCAVRAKSSEPQIDKITGIAEIRRSGETGWEYIDPTTNFYNNDQLRTLRNSILHFSWPNNDTAFINQNSRLIFSSFSGSKTSLTLLSGEAFFTNQRNDNSTENMIIYTDNLKIYLNGSLLLRIYDNQSTLKLVTGTTRIRDMRRNRSYFLRAPEILTFKNDGDGLTRTFVTEDMEYIKSWVPERTVQRIKQDYLHQAKRDHLILAGRFDNKVLVTPLLNNSDYSGSWDLTTEITTLFKGNLENNLDHLTFETHTHPKDNKNSEELIYLARNSRSRYIVIGSIESFDLMPFAEISAEADMYREYVIARVHLNIGLFDASVERITFESSFSGEVSSSDVANTTWETMEEIPFDLNHHGFLTSLIAQALKKCLENVNEKIAGLLY
ncbi:hypothetical protein CHISP_0794 [Chitinispirillum alkaliphilum]|nr:hypothetical protein CHISP_0794 [Chitinispirillum alkaliphilum]